MILKYTANIDEILIPHRKKDLQKENEEMRRRLGRFDLIYSS